MAETPKKPPDAIGLTKSFDGDFIPKPRSTCACTKISIMQLFHEMKQKFATVPDHIVCQYVMDNCHNRPACIDILEKESEGYPGSVQAYPQALRNNNKRPLTPRRAAPGLVNSDQLELIKKSNSIPKSEVTLSDNNTSDMQPNKNIELDKQKVPQRPNTLNIGNVPNNSFPPLNNRPTRTAPAPPSALPHSQGQRNQHFYHQAPSTASDSNESLNVSLNVTVSPVSGRPPARPPRHTTALSVHPEPAFTRDSQQCPRSYTSVNFTLRQPANTPQSPIEITAGPSLTYSSRSYDARACYQSHLEITVGGGGGSISASRTRPRSCLIPKDNEFNSLSSMRAGVSMPNVTAANSSLDEAEIVHRQLLCKQRLSVELENDKKRLQIMLRELRVLQSPIPPGGASSLIDEIEQLRNNCNQMVQEVEEAGPSYVLGETNEAFYPNIYTGQRLPIHQNRPPRPPRPPPPYVLRCLSGNTAANNINDANTNQEGGQPWTCNMCTFQNHPLLNKCEQCEMPLLSSSGTVQSNTPQILTPRLQHIPYEQSVPPIVQSPFQHNPSIGFSDLPRLTQQH